MPQAPSRLNFVGVGELAETYDPSDDDAAEIPGQDALWEPSFRSEPAAQNDPFEMAVPFEVAEATGAPPVKPATPSRTPRSPAKRAPTSSENRAPSSAGKGITARGVIVLISVFTALVGVISVIASGHRGPLFGVAFVLASAGSAYLVRRRDMLVAVAAPPLIYCGLIVFMSLIDSGGTTGGLTTRIGVYIGDGFVTGAPSIWIGTAAATAVVWWRAGGTLRKLPPALDARRKNRRVTRAR
jgi:hypothetical protein